MMHIRNHNLSLATGVAWLVAAVLVTANGYAQPARHSRNRVTPIVGTANAQTVQPQQQAAACLPDDANVARQHRGLGLDAFEAHDWATCAAEYGVAQARCSTPEAGFNLAYCLENQGQLLQAIQRYEELLGGGRLPAEVTAEQLRRTIESVRARLPRMTVTVVAPPAINPSNCGANLQTDPANCGACGNRCNAGATCTAGQCRAVVTAPPVATPTPRRSHLVPAVLFAGAGALMATGIPLAVVAGNDAATLCDVQGRTTGCNRLQSGIDPRTVSTVAWVMAGTGAALAVAGLVVELIPRNHAAPPSHGITARPTATLTPDGTATVGLVGTF